MALTQTGLGCGGAAASYQSCRAAQLQSVVLFHTLFAQMAERGIEWLKLSRREHPLPSSLYLTRGGLIYEHVHKGATLGGGNYKKVCRLASLIPGVKEMVQAPYDATALARLGPRYLTEFIQILQRLKRALAEEEEDVPLLVPSIMVYFSRKSWEMKVCQFMPRMEEDLFEARCRFSFDQKVVIAKAVARALAFMHRNGVAHLDVKIG